MPITVSINVTPDGFCNHDDVAADDEFMINEAALIEAADHVLIGRKTYELFVDYWPAAARNEKLGEAERRLARAIDETPRLVVSGSLEPSDWQGTRILERFDRDIVSDLSANQQIICLGSPSIFTQLADWNVIDRYHFVIEPFVSGKGKRLFPSHRDEDRTRLALEDCKSFAGGAVSLTYAKANSRLA